MTPQEVRAILADLDHHVEGDAFRVNLYLRGGHTLSGYAVDSKRPAHVLLCLKDDHPPVFVSAADIVMLELSNG